MTRDDFCTDPICWAIDAGFSPPFAWQYRKEFERMAAILEPRIREMRADADRWFYARKFLDIDTIEGWVKMSEAGHVPDEQHSTYADEAVDAAIWGKP